MESYNAKEFVNEYVKSLPVLWTKAVDHNGNTIPYVIAMQINGPVLGEWTATVTQYETDERGLIVVRYKWTTGESYIPKTVRTYPLLYAKLSPDDKEIVVDTSRELKTQ